MISQTKPSDRHSDLTRQPVLTGRDEMNLAEFPVTKLGSRDKREVLTYEGWTVGTDKKPYRQAWTVRGATGLGLPSELGDRVILALLALTFQQDLSTRRVEFSRYRLLKMLGLDPQGRTMYDKLETALRQLVGLTIESEHAFFDKSKQRRVVSQKAFHLLDKLWLRKEHTLVDDDTPNRCSGYIVWSKEIWQSLQAGYIKNIDLAFYYSLSTPLARRLYRLLDKRLHHQNQLEMDIFDLSARLGQTRYAKPSQVYRKLQPGIRQLVDQKFLADACLVKHGKYTRVRFTKAGAGERTARRQKQAAIQDEFAQVLKAYRTDADTQKVWRSVLRTLKSQLSESQYAMVGESALLKLADSRAEVCLASPFAVQWLHRHAQIRDQIVELLQTKARITDLEVGWVNRKTLFENLEKCS